MKLPYLPIALLCCLVPPTLMGCATAEPFPRAALLQSERSLRIARDLGARDDQEAAAHLVVAEQQMAEAYSLISAGEKARAAAVLRRVIMDAQLAQALTMDHWARGDAEVAAAARRAEASRRSLRTARSPR